MRLLLDTHAFLWFIHDEPELSNEARDLIEDGGNEIWLSVVSCWEIAIKFKIGKLNLTEPFEVLIPREIATNAFQILDINYAHTEKTIQLDLYHRDPFDRLLIAQSLVEQMPLISNETLFDQYAGLDRRW